MPSETLFVTLTGKSGELVKSFKEAGIAAKESSEKSHASWSHAGKVIAGIGAGIVGVAGAIAVKSIGMADAYETAHARMTVALQNTGSSWAAQGKAIDKVSASAVAFGYTKTDVEQALSQMTTGMGSASKAMQYFGVVEDVAAKTGKPLSESAMAVTKAFEGQLRPLKMLGIDLPVAAGGALKVEKAQTALVKAQTKLNTVTTAIHDGLIKGKPAWFAYQSASEAVKAAQDKLNTTQQTGTTILSDLGRMMDGNAAAAADTFGGKLKALHAWVSNVQINIGMWLIPKITALVKYIQDHVVPTVSKVVEWFGKHKAITQALGIAVAAFAATALVAYIAGMVAAAAATVAATWPILAVIAVVAALALGAKYMYDHWDTIWTKIQRSPAYPAIALLITAVKQVIEGVKTVVKWVGDNWPGIWAAASTAIKPAADAIKTALGPLVTMIQTINSGLETMGSLIDHLPTMKPTDWNAQGAPGNPTHAQGGSYYPTTTTTSPNDWYAPGNPGYVPPSGSHNKRAAGGPVMPFTTYLVGERGPEMLTMGSGGGYVHPNQHGGTVNVTVNVNGMITGNARQMGQHIADLLASYQRGSGVAWQHVGTRS